MPISTINTNSIADDAVTVPKVTDQVLTHRNLIINGAMQVAQRGTSATGVTSGGFHTVDRLNSLLNSVGTWTFSQDTDVPLGQGFSYSNKRQCTTANASLSSSAYFVDYYSIEGQDLQQLAFGTSSAKSLTLSFWVKTNKTGTYQITFTTASAIKSIGSSYTVNAANTWEKKTLTIVGDTATGIVNANTAGLTIEMWYAAGTDFNSGTMPTAWEARVSADRAAALTVNLADSTSNYLNITGLQLEVGSVATPFEHRSYGDELARCQRYYQLISSGTGGPPICNACAYSAIAIFGVLHLVHEMRAAPTLELVTGTDYYTFLRTGTNDPFDSFSLVRSKTNMVEVYANSGLSQSQGVAGWIRGNNGAHSFAVTSEL